MPLPPPAQDASSQRTSSDPPTALLSSCGVKYNMSVNADDTVDVSFLGWYSNDFISGFGGSTTP